LVDRIGIVNISKGTWSEVDGLFRMMMADGWEILAIKHIPGKGVYALVQERILDWLTPK